MRGLGAVKIWFLVVVVAACAPELDRPSMTLFQPTSFQALPGWSDDAVGEALPALRRSCGVMMKQPDSQVVGPGGNGGTIGRWKPACRAAAGVVATDSRASRVFFETWFEPYQVVFGGTANGTFTGYYEAELQGALKPSNRYRTPIFAKPNDLVTVDLGQFREEWKHETVSGRVEGGRLKRYPDRAAIDADGLDGIAAPLLWVSDPVDAFILHIQGSGRVHLDDGSTVRVGYAADNGHRFSGITRTMVERGFISPDQMSMPAVRRWLRSHPEQASGVMAVNSRYIFFKMVVGDGPIGAEGVALTAGRSLAVDRRFIPLGSPLWLDTVTPDGEPLRRLMVAQDTGNAITGAVRGDYFWGTGEKAFELAGRMKSQGRYYILLPRVDPGAGKNDVRS